MGVSVHLRVVEETGRTFAISWQCATLESIAQASDPNKVHVDVSSGTKTCLVQSHVKTATTPRGLALDSVRGAPCSSP